MAFREGLLQKIDLASLLGAQKQKKSAEEEALLREQLKAMQLANKQAEHSFKMSLSPDMITRQPTNTKGTDIGVYTERLNLAPGYITGVPSTQVFGEKAATDRAMIAAMAGSGSRGGRGGGGGGEGMSPQEQSILDSQASIAEDQARMAQQKRSGYGSGMADILAQQVQSQSQTPSTPDITGNTFAPGGQGLTVQQAANNNQSRLLRDVMSGQSIQSPQEASIIKQNDAAQRLNEKNWEQRQQDYINTGDKALLADLPLEVRGKLDNMRNAKNETIEAGKVREKKQTQLTNEQKKYQSKVFNDVRFKGIDDIQKQKIIDIINQKTIEAVSKDMAVDVDGLLTKYLGPLNK